MTITRQEQGIILAKKYLRQSKEFEASANEYRQRAIDTLTSAGYCTCDYSHYRIDEKGNCSVCDKPSRSRIFSNILNNT